MVKCLECGVEIVQTPGKRAKVFCSAKHRALYHSKRKEKEPKYVQFSTHQEVLKENELLRGEVKTLQERLAPLMSETPSKWKEKADAAESKKGNKTVKEFTESAGYDLTTKKETEQNPVIPAGKKFTKMDFDQVVASALDNAPVLDYNGILALAKSGANTLSVEAAIQKCKVKLTPGQVQMIRSKIIN